MKILSIAFLIVLSIGSSAFCQTFALGFDRLVTGNRAGFEYDPIFNSEIRLPIIRSDQMAHVELILSKKKFEHELNQTWTDETGQIITSTKMEFEYDIMSMEMALIVDPAIKVINVGDMYLGIGGGYVFNRDPDKGLKYGAGQEKPATQTSQNYPSFYTCAGLKIILSKSIKLDIRGSLRQISVFFIDEEQRYLDQIYSLYANLNFKLFKK